MSTIVYLANQKIQIITGSGNNHSVSVKKCYSFDAPEGCIINGTIMDPGLFISYMKDVWDQKGLPSKDVYLIINSTKFIGKTITMPVMKDNKSIEYIAREYADIGREDMIFSHIHIANAEGKMKKIYAEGIDPAFISEYVDIFAEFGVRLSHVYSAESSMITLTKNTVARSNKTFVLLVADSMMLSTILWIDGEFYYYNQSRCFNDPGTNEYAQDIARSLSQLSQFMQANRIESSLEIIQIAGVKEDSIYNQAITEAGITTPVKFFSFPDKSDAELHNYLNAISGLYDGGKNEDFLSQLTQIKKVKEKTALGENFVKHIWAIVILFVIMLAIIAALVAVNFNKKKELRELEDYNSSYDVIMNSADYDMYSTRNEYLQKQYEAIDSVAENLKSYPCGNSNVMNVFKECAKGYADVQYESFDAKEGTVVILATADNVENINKFIQNLTTKEVFGSVDYTGYEYQEAANLWNIYVTCTLAESAGR